MLSLGELIASSGEVISKNGIRSYGQSSVFKKEFGQIYYSEKVAYYNEAYKILELRVTMGSESDSNDSLHVIRMAFKDVEGKVYNNKKELLEAIGITNSRKKLTKFDSSVSKNTQKDADTFKEYGGLLIPCTVDPSINNDYSDNFLPSGRYFYSKTGITLNNLCCVSCSCSSYRYTFAEYNANAKAHLGPVPTKYRTASPRRWRRLRNESVLNVHKKPGLCKHLMLFSMLLLSGELLKGYTDLSKLRKDLRKMESTNDNVAKINKQERYKVGTTDTYAKIKEMLDEHYKEVLREKEEAAQDKYIDAYQKEIDRAKATGKSLKDPNYAMSDFDKAIERLEHRTGRKNYMFSSDAFGKARDMTIGGKTYKIYDNLPDIDKLISEYSKVYQKYLMKPKFPRGYNKRKDK